MKIQTFLTETGDVHDLPLSSFWSILQHSSNIYFTIVENGHTIIISAILCLFNLSKTLILVIIRNYLINSQFNFSFSSQLFLRTEPQNYYLLHKRQLPYLFRIPPSRFNPPPFSSQVKTCELILHRKSLGSILQLIFDIYIQTFNCLSKLSIQIRHLCFHLQTLFSSWSLSSTSSLLFPYVYLFLHHRIFVLLPSYKSSSFNRNDRS